MSTATSHASCRLGANILRSSKQRNDTLGDFNPPQTSEERVFQSRPGRKIWSLACHDTTNTTRLYLCLQRFLSHLHDV